MPGSVRGTKGKEGSSEQASNNTPLSKSWIGGSFGIVLTILVVIISIQAMIDCDLLLYFLPYDDKNTLQNKNIPFPGHFRDQVIWITGASSGIGAALALDLVKGGAKVIISARREEQLISVQKQASKMFPPSEGFHPIHVMPLDVLDYQAQESVTKSILESFGNIDTLVLNAGRSQRSLAVDFNLAGTKDLFELNFFSYVSLTKLVLPSMQKRRSGHIVVISSLAGKMGVPISSSYSSTKFALSGFFDAVRAEVSRDNIHITMVCPGPVQSEIVANAMLADLATPSGTALHSIKNEDNEKKMTTERCTYLISKAMKFKLDEVWISQQPYLALTYLSTYAPGIMRQLWKKVIGPARVKAMLQGGDVYDVKQLFGMKK